MSIQAQQTPNPNARKFILPAAYFTKALSFPSVEAAAAHPLAAAIFALDGVYNVFMVQDFVTVNKRPDVDWAALEATIQQAIERYLDGAEIEA
ncbi:MAG: NifU N-terminal domain-containing protein [Caldilineaceae bacterium]|nr:NifU N-terminal domain-containing protein [Caldilineaceae bacterium]